MKNSGTPVKKKRRVAPRNHRPNPAVDSLGEPLLSAKAVAHLLHCSFSYVFLLGRNGELPCVRMGKAVRFRRQDIAGFIHRHLSTQKDK